MPKCLHVILTSKDKVHSRAHYSGEGSGVCSHLAHWRVGSPDDASGIFTPGTKILRKSAGGHLTPNMKERGTKVVEGTG